MSYCTKCQEVLTKDGDGIFCKGCDGNLHYECSTVKKSTYTAMSSRRKNEWRCDFCRFSKKISEMIEKKFTTEIVEIREIAKETNSKLKVTEEKIDKVYAELQQRNTELENKVSILENKLNNENNPAQDSKIINILSKKINELEQKEKEKEIVIHGVPEKNNENLLYVLNKIGNIVNVAVGEEDIEKIYRIKSYTKQDTNETTADNIKPIAVQFKNKNIRDKILQNKKTKIAAKDIGEDENPSSKIRIQEMMTTYNKKLLKLSKQKTEEKGWKYAWFSFGKIKVRKNEKDKFLTIGSEYDLLKIE